MFGRGAGCLVQPASRVFSLLFFFFSPSIFLSEPMLTCCFLSPGPFFLSERPAPGRPSGVLFCCLVCSQVSGRGMRAGALMNGEDLNERWEGRGVCDSRQSREKQLWLTVLSLGCPLESPESLFFKKKKKTA